MKKSNGSSDCWTIEFDPDARRDLRRLDPQIRRRIIEYMTSRPIADGNPRLLGEALQGHMAGLWRYRIGDYRAICRIEDDRLVIIVVAIGHRREVYR